MRLVNKNSKCSQTLGLLVSITALLAACGTVVENSEATKPVVDTEKPATYAEYKAWRDQYDPDAKEYADFKAWEEQYRRWQWEQQQQTGR